MNLIVSKNKCFVFLVMLACSQFAFADDTIILNQTIQAKNRLKTFTYNIRTASEPNQSEYEFLIQNGDGLNYFQQTCPGNVFEEPTCHAENVLRNVRVMLDRPSDLEIKLNDQILVNRQSFPAEQGQMVLRRVLAGEQNLKITLKGLPTSSVTIKVTKFGESVNQLPIADFSFSSTGFTEPSLVSFSGLLSRDADGVITNYSWDFDDGNFASGALVNHIYENAGTYHVSLTVTDDRGGMHTQTQMLVIESDTVGPVLTNIQPVNNSTLTGTSILLSAESNEALSKVEIKVNSDPIFEVPLNGQFFSFSTDIQFTGGGTKNITVTAYDNRNNSSVYELTYFFNFNNPPVPKIKLLSQSSTEAPAMLWFDASESTDIDQDALTFEWTFGDGATSNEVKPTHLFKEGGSFNVVLKVTDARGSIRTTSYDVELQSIPIPIDPAEIAPPLTENFVQTKEEKYSFIYDQPESPQKNLDLTKLDEDRITPLSGRVLVAENQPLAGVKVTINNHPEFGYTYTRADGQWNLVANGGGDLIIEFNKVGYGTTQRSINTYKNTSRVLEDVYFSAMDESKTVVSLNSNQLQVHEATAVNDERGLRRTQVLIPENTTAELVMPDGSRQSVSSLTIRATELTVGENGPRRMPAPLPKRTAYTYCADFTADEAMAKGAKSVEFSQPVPIYVDNFLNIPAGYGVPVGFYDFDKALWIAEPDAAVIYVLGVTNDGRATLNLGNGQIATEPELAALYITDNELQHIATKYQAGQSFWRARVKHFSPIDINFTYTNGGLLAGGGGGGGARTGGGGGGGGGAGGGCCGPPPPPGCATLSSDPGIANLNGCVIDPRTQTLFENITLHGLDFNLNYSSEKVVGANLASTIFVDVNPQRDLNNELCTSVKIKIEIEGKLSEHSQSCPTETFVYQYAWDGYDQFGRQVFSASNAKVSVTYVFPGAYRAPIFVPEKVSFNSIITRNWVSVPSSDGLVPLEVTSETNLSVASPFDQTLYANVRSMNGWSIDPYHVYDIEKKILYLGNGTKYGNKLSRLQVKDVAGNGSAINSGDDGQAKSAGIAAPTDIKKDAAGNIYFTGTESGVIRKIDVNGIISHVAGNGDVNDYQTGDGGPAVTAGIGKPAGLHVTELGEIYFTDMAHGLVRKIDKDGIISRIAGTGVNGFSGNDGLALAIKLNSPMGIALDKDGFIYVCDTNNNAIRVIDTNGRIFKTYEVIKPYFGIFDANGIYHFTARKNIYRINSETSATVLAGNSSPFDSPFVEGGGAVGAWIYPMNLAIDNTGMIYFTDEIDHAIRYIFQGSIYTKIGVTGIAGYNGGGLFLNQVLLNNPRGLEFTKEGALLFADRDNNRIRMYGKNLKEEFPLILPSADGSEIYYFNDKGQHIQTKTALTGAVRYNFTHNSEGYLTEVHDAYNNVTTINRDSNNNLSSIVGPYGQNFSISLNSLNQIKEVTNDEGLTYKITYTNSGLLNSFTKPKGQVAQYSYNEKGKLTQVIEPNLGVKELIETGGVVTYKTALSYTRQYQQHDADTATLTVRSLSVGSDGMRILKLEDVQKGESTISGEDSLVTTQQSANDPRFENYSSYISSHRKTNLAVNSTYSYQQNISYTMLPDAQNFIRTKTFSDNAGQSTTSSFNTATKTSSSVTSLGRSVASVVDSQERPVRVQTGSFLPVEYEYNNRGNLSKIKQGVRETSFGYDSKGFLNSIIDPENRNTQFVNDSIGRVKKTITPEQSEVLFSYDENSNIISITPPGKPAHLFTYNASDLIQSYKAPGQNFKTYNYDLDNRLTSVTDETDFITNLIYFSPQNASAHDKLIQTQSDLNFSYSYGNFNTFALPNRYDLVYTIPNTGDIRDTVRVGRAGDLISGKSYTRSFRGESFGLAYEYSPQGMLETREYTLKTSVSKSYNADKQITQAGALVIGYENTAGLPVTKTLGSWQEIISYNDYAEISSREYRHNNVLKYKEIYTRDKLGRITVKDITKNNTNTVQVFEYDLNGRLAKVYENSVLKTTYAYDANGNRLIKTTSNGDIFHGSYDDSDRIIEYSENGVSSTYTYSGNNTGMRIVRTKNGVPYYYNISRMNIMTDNSTVNYIIDAEGNRGGIESDPAHGGLKYFVHDKNNRLLEVIKLFEGPVVRYVYATQGHSPDYMISKIDGVEENYFFIKDQLGSILQVVAEDGTIKQEMQYDEFGIVTMNTNPNLQPLGFAGGLTDESGLVKFGARDYDPMLGRWLEADPIGFSGKRSNLYTYTDNDPINKIDPDGLTPKPPQEGLPKDSCNPFTDVTCIPIFCSDIPEFWACVNYPKPPPPPAPPLPKPPITPPPTTPPYQPQPRPNPKPPICETGK